ncbi:MAG: SNF2-related protein [Desulfosporosinus sp.]|nr:SNF2-related protein [Desulfosporosinus sp.]
MPDSLNKVVFEIPANLRVLNSLPLENKLKDLFSPFAKSTVVLLDAVGSWVLANVNSQATLLKGAELINFLEAQGSFRLECSHLGENYFRVLSKREITESNIEQIATQLFLDFGAEEPAISENSKPHGKLNAALVPKKPIVKPKEKLQEKPKESLVTKSNQRLRDMSHSQTKTQPLLSTPSPTPTPAQRTSASKKKVVSESKDALADRSNKNVPDQNVLKDIENGKVLSKNLRKEKKNKEASQSIQPKYNSDIKPQSLPVLQPRRMSTPSVGQSLVKVVFHTTEDAQLLRNVKEGLSSPTSDFYLRQQALQLSVSPGFETLMALKAARLLQPLDYQLRTVRHVLMNLRGRALLCDEVGMGKTVEAGLITLEYILRGLVRRVLVLSPPSLVEQWQEEMRSKFNLDFAVYDSAEFKAHPDPWATFPRIIASIDTAKRETKQEQVLAVPYDLVIVDEAHHLKKQRSQAYRLVSELKKKYILLLTATPVENDLEELFNLITLLLPGQLETAASFKRKYITRGDPLKPKNTETLKQLIREVMVRNRRSETGAIAGRRSAEMIYIELTPEEKAFYQRLTVFVRGYYSAGAAKAQGGVHTFVLKILQREAGSSIEAVLPTLHKMAANQNNPESLRGVLTTLAKQAENVPRRAKVEALLQLLPGIRGKVIIFTGFTETQRYLVRTLRVAGLQVAELHSGLRRQEKEEQVRLFAGEVDILVSTETGSEGRNLQFANHMINYDLPWNPMRIEQRIGRIHRIGQEQDVHIYNFSAVDTIEAHILEILDAKINMFQLVVGELDMILGDLTEKRDFEDLIMDIWAQSNSDEVLKSEMQELGDRLVVARDHYLAVKKLDDRLLGELAPEEGE